MQQTTHRDQQGRFLPGNPHRITSTTLPTITDGQPTVTTWTKTGNGKIIRRTTKPRTAEPADVSENAPLWACFATVALGWAIGYHLPEIIRAMAPAIETMLGVR